MVLIDAQPPLCCSFAPEKMAIHCSWLPLTNHIPMFDSPKTRVPWRMNQLPCLLKDFVLRIDSQRRPPSNVVGFRQVFTSHLELNVLRRWRSTAFQQRTPLRDITLLSPSLGPYNKAQKKITLGHTTYYMCLKQHMLPGWHPYILQNTVVERV